MKHAFLTLIFLFGFSAMVGAGSATNVVISVVVGDGYVLKELATGDECEASATSISVDQDGIATLDEPGLLDIPILPGPEDSTNAVAVALLEMLRLADVDYFDQTDENGMPYTTQPVVPTWTWDGFLGKDETNGWTRVAKKACFDWYLNYIATNRCDFSDLQTNLVSIAVSQCEDLKYTNAWCWLEGITRNPVAPHRRWSGELAIAYAPVGPLLDLGLDAATNNLQVTSEEREAIVDAFAARLTECHGAATSNAVHVLYRIRESESGISLTFDRLFISRIAGYSISSNRFETAKAYLSKPELSELQRVHFSTVTNQLMNAAQPLPEVEALRGL